MMFEGPCLDTANQHTPHPDLADNLRTFRYYFNLNEETLPRTEESASRRTLLLRLLSASFVSLMMLWPIIVLTDAKYSRCHEHERVTFAAIFGMPIIA